MKEEQLQDFKMQVEDNTDIIEIVKSYLRYWPWFILSTVICLAASYLYLRYTPKIYETNAKIKILQEGSGVNLDMEGLMFNRPGVVMENEIQILTSYRILEKVEKALQLRNSFYIEGGIQTTQTNSLPFTFKQILGVDSLSIKGSFEINVTPSAFEVYNVETDSTSIFVNHDTSLTQHNLPFQIKIESPKQLAACLGKQFNIHIKSIESSILGLRGSLKVENVGDYSTILELSINGQSTSRSERILNAVIEAFNKDGIEDRQLVSKRTLEFIDERFIFLSQELDSIELIKKEFKQDNNLFTIETDAGISLNNEAKADDEVFRIENQLALSQLLEEAMKNPNSENQLLPSDFGLESSIINSLITRYNTAISSFDKLINNGGVNNPIVKQLQDQLRDLRANIDSSLRSYTNQLKLSQRQLSSRDKKFKSEVYNLPQKEKLLRAIERQQQIKESLFLLLLQKREEAMISLAVTEPSIKVVEYALSNSLPISPKPRSAYAVAIVIGMVIPFGILFVIFLFDDKIHSKNHMEKLTSNIPIIGEIPKIKDANNLLFTRPSDRSMLAESFRILSSNVDYILPITGDRKAKVVYITSTKKGEGKTFISINLSLALSSLNKKVLLIGADLRNPQLHNYIDSTKNKQGLSNYLYDVNNDWKESLIKGFKDHPNHDILISGAIPPNPPYLLTNGRFEALLEEAKNMYDYIIVDTAPTIAVTDTLLISKFADATVYVTRANYTEENLLGHSNLLSKDKKLKNMAYVINQVGARKGYGYNYGYGYGYGEDIKKRSWRDKIFKR